MLVFTDFTHLARNDFLAADLPGMIFVIYHKPGPPGYFFLLYKLHDYYIILQLYPNKAQLTKLYQVINQFSYLRPTLQEWFMSYCLRVQGLGLFLLVEQHAALEAKLGYGHSGAVPSKISVAFSHELLAVTITHPEDWYPTSIHLVSSPSSKPHILYSTW